MRNVLCPQLSGEAKATLEFYLLFQAAKKNAIILSFQWTISGLGAAQPHFVCEERHTSIRGKFNN